MTLAPRVTQFPPTPTRCDPANCGAATAAWLANNVKGVTTHTAAGMRALSGYDCISHPTAPGFFSSTIVATLAKVGVQAELVAGSGTMAMLLERTGRGDVAAILGEYGQLDGTVFEKSRSFQGSHWGGVGDPQPASIGWADPIKTPGGTPPVRLPLDLMEAFWLKRKAEPKLPTGFAVFVAVASEEDSVLTIRPYAAPRRFTVQGTITGYKATDGKLAAAITRGFPVVSGAHADSAVTALGPNAGEYVHVVDGTFAGLLVPLPSVKLDPDVAPKPDTAALDGLLAPVQSAAESVLAAIADARAKAAA